jgi:hypothetical protein
VRPAWDCVTSIVAAAIACAVIFTVRPTASRADVLGADTDPLKLLAASRELSESVDRTLNQLAALDGRANYDVQQRLEQVRTIVHQAIVDDAQ